MALPFDGQLVYEAFSFYRKKKSNYSQSQIWPNDSFHWNRPKKNLVFVIWTKKKRKKKHLEHNDCTRLFFPSFSYRFSFSTKILCTEPERHFWCALIVIKLLVYFKHCCWSFLSSNNFIISLPTPNENSVHSQLHTWLRPRINENIILFFVCKITQITFVEMGIEVFTFLLFFFCSSSKYLFMIRFSGIEFDVVGQRTSTMVCIQITNCNHDVFP